MNASNSIKHPEEIPTDQGGALDGLVPVRLFSEIDTGKAPNFEDILVEIPINQVPFQLVSRILEGVSCYGQDGS